MSKMKKVLTLLALAGFMGACANNSGGGSAPGNNQDAGRDTTTAPEAGVAGFAASHSGSFEISGWAGASLNDVMSVEDLDARVAGFEDLAFSIDTFGTMGVAEGRSYQYDRGARILRLNAGGHNLEVTSTGAVLSAMGDDTASEQGQGQMTKEAPRNLPCRLYEEEVKQEEQKIEDKVVEQGQDQKGDDVKGDDTKVVDQGQTGEQGQTQSQEQKQEVQQPENVIVRCEQTITSEQEQGQSQAQVKPESKTEILHILLTLTPEVKEVKQEQAVEKVEEQKQEVAQEQKQETKVEEKAPVVKEEVKKEEVKQEQKQETKEEKKEVAKEETKEQKQEQKGETKGEGKKPGGQGQG